MTNLDDRKIIIESDPRRVVTVNQFAHSLAGRYVTAQKFKRVLCAAIRALCLPQQIPPPSEVVILARSTSGQWRLRLTPTSAKWDKLEAD